MQFQQFLNQHYKDQTFIHVTNLQEHIFENSFIFKEAARAQTTLLPKEKSPPKRDGSHSLSSSANHGVPSPLPGLWQAYDGGRDGRGRPGPGVAGQVGAGQFVPRNASAQ